MSASQHTWRMSGPRAGWVGPGPLKPHYTASYSKRQQPEEVGWSRRSTLLRVEVPAWDRNGIGVEYVWRAVADHVAARIAAGEFPRGAMLPGERDAAEYYGVGVVTYRRAVRELVERGLITVLPAKGTYVT